VDDIRILVQQRYGDGGKEVEKITIMVQERYGQKEILGYLDDREIIMLHETEQGWKIGSTTCFPTDFKTARGFLSVFKAAFEEADSQRRR